MNHVRFLLLDQKANEIHVKEFESRDNANAFHELLVEKGIPHAVYIKYENKWEETATSYNTKSRLVYNALAKNTPFNLNNLKSVGDK